MTTDYATGRRLYLDDQPLEACASPLARDGWLDAEEGIRRSAEEVDDSWEDALAAETLGYLDPDSGLVG